MTIVSVLPVTLTNGTTADATQVMLDLQSIANNVNANAAGLNQSNNFAAGTTQTINSDVIVTQTAAQTLSGKNVVGYTPVVETIASVRSLLKTGNPKVLVTGYYASGDGGGGVYYYDSADITSTDNGGTVIVASDGGRWKLVHYGSVTTQQFGVKHDDSTDNTTALNNAFSQTNLVIVISAGIARYNTALNAPLCAGIVGLGDLVSILKPGASATKGLGLNSNSTYPRLLRDFQLLGTLTTNATGLFLGDTANKQVSVRVENVRTKGFGGASGVGRRIGECLKAIIIGSTSEQNGTNTLVQGVTGSFPTTVDFNSCVDTGSTAAEGCKIINCDELHFVNHDFESNYLAGCKVDSSAGGSITELTFDAACRFEDNWTSLGGARNANYHLMLGTNSGAGTIRATVGPAYFVTDGSAVRPLAFIANGSEVAGLVIAAPRFTAGTSNAIVVNNNAYGSVPSWCSQFNFVTTVSDPLNKLSWWDGGYRTYTPTYSSDLGNAATTFSGGTVTTSRAAYKITGKTLFIELNFSATLNAVTPNYIQVSLPSNITTASNALYQVTILKNGSFTTGAVRTDGAGNLLFYKSDLGATNFTSGAAIAADLTISIALT